MEPADFGGAVTGEFLRPDFLTFRPFLCVYQHAKVDDVRDLFAYLKRLAPCPARCAITTCRFHSMSGAISGFWETHVHGRQAVEPDAAHSPSGIAALSGNSLGHCASATVPVTFLAALSPHSASPVDQIGRRGWVPNITQKGLSGGARRTSPISSKPVRRPMATRRRGDGPGDQKHSQLTLSRRRIAEYVKSLAAGRRTPRPRRRQRGDDS